MKLVMEKLQVLANEQVKVREKIEQKEAEDRLRELRTQAKNFEMQATARSEGSTGTSPPKGASSGNDLGDLKAEFMQF